MPFTPTQDHATKTYARLLATAKRVNESPAVSATPKDAIELALLVLALDSWLNAGGQIPAQWEALGIVGNEVIL